MLCFKEPENQENPLKDKKSTKKKMTKSSAKAKGSGEKKAPKKKAVKAGAKDKAAPKKKAEAKKASPKKKAATKKAPIVPEIDPRHIEVAAYYHYRRRLSYGHLPDPVADWYAAEAEILSGVGSN